MPKIPLTIDSNKKPSQASLLDEEFAPHFSSAKGTDLANPLKVSELVARLKADVEDKHRYVRVVGEISSFKQWRSGHCYFDIKDDQAVLPAVIFRPHFLRVPFAVADGLEVLFSGRVSVYQANAKLQMIVEAMEPLGQGALALAFEQVKDRLKAEGLFEALHKKPVKSFNQCVGLITSSHGAVLRDMVRILKNRMPNVDIIFSPVRVQGQGAALEIKTAIELLDNLGACDVIIVGRGGGSLEDLWPFNEEIVARAIFKANTPIISAVGHETDTTISDFVADIRAATPTHAASMVVPDLRDIWSHLTTSLASLKLKHQANLRNGLLAIAKEKRRLVDPRILLFRHWQKLDEGSNQLSGSIGRIVQKHKKLFLSLNLRLQQLAPFRQLRLRKDALFLSKTRLIQLCPSNALKQARGNLVNITKLLHDHGRTQLYLSRQQFEQLVTKLEALSPLKVLKRGYGAIQNEDGAILSKMAHFKIEQTIKIRIDDGVLTALITDKE